MTVTIAIDGMGGDKAPDVIVDGAALYGHKHPDVAFILYGDAAQLQKLLDAKPALKAVTRLVHTPDFVASDVKPSIALRQGRNSSMRLAINAVKTGEAHAAVSAGNTGALMAMAKIVLRMLPGIDRPAIMSLLPSKRGPVVALDLGANVDCDADHLFQFAVMGEVFARTNLGIDKPKVGLLNIGTEEMKGGDVVRAAAARLRESSLPIDFRGFIEGTDVTGGTVDVVVTDGFTGNVALKIAEGTASMYTGFLREAFKSGWRAKLGYLLARDALGQLRQRVDPRRYNGAMFLGVNGVVVKSHGGTDAFGFANAIGVAVDLVRKNANERIIEDLREVETAVPDTAKLVAT